MMMLLQLGFRGRHRACTTTAFSSSGRQRLSKLGRDRYITTASYSSFSIKLFDTARSYQGNITNPGVSSSHNNQLPTNQELVQRRLAVQRSKRQARERSIQDRVSKNLHIKRF